MNLLYEEKTDFLYIEKEYNSVTYYSPLCKRKLLSERYVLESNGAFAKCLIKGEDCRVTIDWVERNNNINIQNSHLISTGFSITTNGLKSINTLIENNI